MHRSCFSVLLFVSLIFSFDAAAQKRRPAIQSGKNSAAQPANKAVVIDERLAVLRSAPGFYAPTLLRMRRGRALSVNGSKEADGVTFYRVTALPNNYGWVQAEAVAGRFRRGDDARLAKLVQSSEGFEQIERAKIFLDTFPDSTLRPAILLLQGDLLEEVASNISRDATKRLDRREMAASGAPLHSFYLNYVSLDRYRRLGMDFVFNTNSRILHYDGASWREISKKHLKTPEAAEAQKRLDALKEKLEKK